MQNLIAAVKDLCHTLTQCPDRWSRDISRAAAAAAAAAAVSTQDLFRHSIERKSPSFCQWSDPNKLLL